MSNIKYFLLSLSSKTFILMKKFIKAVIVGYVTLWLYDEGKEWLANRNRPSRVIEDEKPLRYTGKIER